MFNPYKAITELTTTEITGLLCLNSAIIYCPFLATKLSLLSTPLNYCLLPSFIYDCYNLSRDRWLLSSVIVQDYQFQMSTKVPDGMMKILKDLIHDVHVHMTHTTRIFSQFSGLGNSW